MSKEKKLLKQQLIDIFALKRLNVFDENGLEVPFSNFLSESKVIIIFVRHFGCMACRAHVDQVWNKNKKKLEGSRVVFIGSGQPYVIRSFKKVMNAEDAEIYTDPSLKTFDACGMHRGILKLVNLKTVSAMRALKDKGYSQGSFKDSGRHTQMGGIVIFKKPGRVIYHFASEHLGDFDQQEDWDRDE